MRPPKLSLPFESCDWEVWFRYGFIVIPTERVSKQPVGKWGHLLDEFSRLRTSGASPDLIRENLFPLLEEIWDPDVLEKRLSFLRKEILGNEKERKKYEHRIAEVGTPALAMLTGIHLESSFHPVVVDVDEIDPGKEFFEKLGLDLEVLLRSTFTVRSQNGGYHIYFLLPEKKVTSLPNRVRVAPGIDIRSRRGCVLVPPSPGYSVFSDQPPMRMPDILYEAFSRRKDERKGNSDCPSSSHIYGGGDDDFEGRVQKLIEVLGPHYTSGQRHALCLALSGTLRKLGFPEEKAVEIISRIADHFQDEEKNDRIRAVKDTYSPKKDRISGTSGLREIDPKLPARLVQALLPDLEFPIGSDRWISCTVYGPVSPAMSICRETKNDVKENIIGYMYPLGIVKKTDPIGEKLAGLLRRIYGHNIRLLHTPSSYSFRVLVPGRGGMEVKDLSGSDDEQVYAEARSLLSAADPRLFRSAISHIYSQFARSGQVIYESERFYHGVFVFDGKFYMALPWSNATSPDDLSEYSSSDLRRDLEEIEKIRAKFYSDRTEIFATVAKYMALAPFSFSIRKKSGFFPHLCLYDSADAGKSSLVEVFSYIFYGTYQKFGTGSVNTPYRLAEALGTSTFPAEFADAREIIEKPQLVDMVKTSVESLVARSRGWANTSIQSVSPALRPIILTVNSSSLRDLVSRAGNGSDADALERRFIMVRFSSEKSIPSGDLRREFDEFLAALRRGRIEMFHALRTAILRWVVGNYDIINIHADYGRSLDEVSTKMWADLFREAGLEVPGWVRQFVAQETPETRDDRRREEVRAKLSEYFVSRVRELPQREYPLSLREGVETLLRTERVPSIRISVNRRGGGEEEVVFHPHVVSSILEHIIDFEGLARILPGASRVRRYWGSKRIFCVVLPLSDFLDFIVPEVAETQTDLELQKLIQETVEGLEALVRGQLTRSSFSEEDIEEYMSQNFESTQEKISSLSFEDLQRLHELIRDERIAKAFLESDHLTHELIEILIQSATTGDSVEDLLKKLQGKDDPDDPGRGGGVSRNPTTPGRGDDQAMIHKALEILAERGHEWAKKGLRWFEKGNPTPLCGLCSQISSENGAKKCRLMGMSIHEFQRACRQFRMNPDLAEEIRRAEDQIPF